MRHAVNSHFNEEWIKAWNDHDLDRIMDHYSDNRIEFYSPVIQQLGVHIEGRISNKKVLREYFKQALSVYPDLKFELLQTFYGVNSIVLYYKSIDNKVTTEFMEFDHKGKVHKAVAHYNSV